MQKVLADRAQKQAGAVGDLSAALKAAKTDLPESWPITDRNLEQVTALLPQALNRGTTDAQSEELGNQMVTLVRQLADESELTLDPFLPSYYMMSPMAFQLPRVIEYLSELEGRLRNPNSDAAATLSFVQSRLGTLGRSWMKFVKPPRNQLLRAVQLPLTRAHKLTPLTNELTASRPG